MCVFCINSSMPSACIFYILRTQARSSRFVHNLGPATMYQKLAMHLEVIPSNQSNFKQS